MRCKDDHCDAHTAQRRRPRRPRGATTATVTPHAMQRRRAQPTRHAKTASATHTPRNDGDRDTYAAQRPRPRHPRRATASTVTPTRHDVPDCNTTHHAKTATVTHTPHNDRGRDTTRGATTPTPTPTQRDDPDSDTTRGAKTATVTHTPRNDRDPHAVQRPRPTRVATTATHTPRNDRDPHTAQRPRRRHPRRAMASTTTHMPRDDRNRNTHAAQRPRP